MEVKVQAIDHRDIFYPPGGILLWLIIILELITFGLGIAGLVYYGRIEPEVFHQSRLQLNSFIGTVNTMVLLISGYFMANTIVKHKSGDIIATRKYLKWTILGGMLFVGLKCYEYVEKLTGNLELEDNIFFTFYWLMTGFHLAHVLVGLVILSFSWWHLKTNLSSVQGADLESGAAFWHMCDLIWLFLFPSLYLIF